MIEVTQAAKSLIRTFAGSARRLDEDLDLSPLQAIDRLHKLDAKFAEHWYGHPWLVLEDGHPLPANMPVAEMLDEIGKRGRAIGIVGVARITARQDSVLAINFCKDTASHKRVEASRKAAAETVEKANEQVAKLAKEIVEDALRGEGGNK